VEKLEKKLLRRGFSMIILSNVFLKIGNCSIIRFISYKIVKIIMKYLLLWQPCVRFKSF